MGGVGTEFGSPTASAEVRTRHCSDLDLLEQAKKKARSKLEAMRSPNRRPRPFRVDGHSSSRAVQRRSNYSPVEPVASKGGRNRRDASRGKNQCNRHNQRSRVSWTRT